MQKLWTRLIGVTVLVLIITSPALDGGLLNYDDERYISGNPWLSSASVKSDESMMTAYFDGHYHPLTLLSLKMDESFGDDAIKSHHRTNWLLHAANTLLIGWFIFLLLGDVTTSVGVALLWGLHPQAVESYAWMTERKNVLYALFFLLSAIQYLKYLRGNQVKHLGLTALFFVLSCLSKGQGILLIPVFFLMDYFEKGVLFNRSQWIQKAGFLIVAFVFAFLNREAQAEAWNLEDTPYALGERFIMGTYAFGVYVLHTVLPYNLIPYVPYPTEVGEEFTWMHYLGLPVVLLYLAALFYTYKKGFKLWFFGLAWFAINIVLLLKILEVPFGNYIYADRYAYLPMVGILTPLVYGIVQRFQKQNANTPIVILSIVAMVFAWVSRGQIKVWESSTQLWASVIEEYPTYLHAGNMYALGALQEGDAQEAIKGFERTIEIDPDLAEPYVNLAILYEQMGQTQKADAEINKAIERGPESEIVLSKAPILLYRRGRVDQAYALSKKGVELFPENLEIVALFARIASERKEYDLALNALEIHRSNAEIQSLYQGIAQRKNNPEIVAANEARAKAERITQNAVNEARNGNSARAVQLFEEAIATDPTFHSAYANRGSFYAQNGRYNLAEEDLLKADELAPQNGQIQAMLGKLYSDMNDQEKSCMYYRKAMAIGVQINPALIANCP